MDAVFFNSPDDFRAWLSANGDQAREVWVGFYKKSADQTGISYPQALDQALCYGWIDGVRKTIDAQRYTIRFTPRKPGSVWSAVNLKRAAELERQGLMQPAGLSAYHGRDHEKTNRYSYEREASALSPEQEAQFRAHPAAWEFFQSQPPSYQKPAIWWVVSAKQDDTRAKRLATLIDNSANGQRIAPLRRPGKSSS